MTHLDTGVTGAKRSSYSKVNHRSVMLEIMRDNPTAGRSEAIHLFKVAVYASKDRKDLIDSALEYAGANEYNRLSEDEAESRAPTRPAGKPRHTPPASADPVERQRRREEREEIEERVERTMRVNAFKMTLKTVLPGGKPLGGLTGAEVAELGVGFNRIAAAVPAKSLVGDVLTDAQIQELWA